MTERPSALPRYTRPLLAEDPVSVGPYLLLARIAHGATGTVYLSRDSSGAWVAVRALHPEHARRTDVRARFAAAVERATRVQGLGTCAVVDAAVGGAAVGAPELPYVVFEFVDGPTLAHELSARGPLAAGELQRLAVDLATAVASLHQARVVHGALDPTDVVLAVTGARLVDLGTSRALAPLLPAEAGPTTVAAPEVLAGADGGPAADVYGWAALVVLAATGRAPGSLPTERTAALASLADGTLGRLVAQALADDPADRPTVADVVAGFTAPRPPRPRSRPRPRPTSFVAAAQPVAIPASRPGGVGAATSGTAGGAVADGTAAGADQEATPGRGRRALVAGAVFLTVAASAAAVAPAVSASGGDSVQSVAEPDAPSDLAVNDVPAPVLASTEAPDTDSESPLADPASTSPAPETTDSATDPDDPNIAVVPLAPRDPNPDPEPDPGPPAPSAADEPPTDGLGVVAPPVAPVTPVAAPPAAVPPPADATDPVQVPVQPLAVAQPSPPPPPPPAQPSPSPSGLTLNQIQVIPLS